MEKYDLKGKTINLHNILFASTSVPDYQMDRCILLEDLEDLRYDEYVVVEGFHCSCYGFEDTQWEATKYTKGELVKLAKVNYTKEYIDSTNDLYDYVLNNFR